MSVQSTRNQKNYDLTGAGLFCKVGSPQQAAKQLLVLAIAVATTVALAATITIVALATGAIAVS